MNVYQSHGLMPTTWSFETRQCGYAFYRTGHSINGWPIFAKQLNNVWRAFEACHHGIKVDGKWLNGKTPNELEDKLVALFPVADEAQAALSAHVAGIIPTVKVSQRDLNRVFGHKCDQPTCPVCHPDMTLTELAELYERAVRR